MNFMSKLTARVRKGVDGKSSRHSSTIAAATASLAKTIPENRELTADEWALIEWLIENGKPDAKSYWEQGKQLHVVSRCSCGCPTIDLAVGDSQSATTGPSTILADVLGQTREGIDVGVILHAREGKICELEIYPLNETPRSLPKIDSLEIFGDTDV